MTWTLTRSATEVGRSPRSPVSSALFEVYVRARLLEDPHVWATVLSDEIGALGLDRSYPNLHPSSPPPEPYLSRRNGRR